MKHRIRAAALIFNNDKKILLVQHVHPVTGFTWWVPPGGGVEKRDNSIFDCVQREAFEETGLRVDVEKIAYISEFFDSDNSVLNLELFCVASAYSGEITIKNIAGNGEDEHFIKRVEWFSQNELRDVIVFPEIIKAGLWDDLSTGFSQVKYLGRH